MKMGVFSPKDFMPDLKWLMLGGANPSLCDLAKIVQSGIKTRNQGGRRLMF